VSKLRDQQLLRQGLERQRAGDAAGAADCFARARVLAPRNPDGWRFGGLLALGAYRTQEAVTLLGRAATLAAGDVDLAISLGIAQLSNGEAAAAERTLAAAAQREPAKPEVWRYLGLVYETQGRTQPAAAARQKLVELSPKFAAGWLDFGSSLSLLGRQTDALACFQRALTLEPDNARALAGVAMVYLRCHRVAETVMALAESLKRNPGDLVARSFQLTSLNYLSGLSRDQVFALHRAFGDAVGPPIARAWPNVPEPARPLRVGFLSRDLREHSVTYFLEPILRGLRGLGFELFLYSDNGEEDLVSARLKTSGAWRVIAGKPDAAVEQLVLEDRIDVLVDLAGHTAGNRLPLLARRLAPVQVAYLGYPNTTGVVAIDYRLVDAITDPAPEADRFATEKLVRFAPTAWAYQPPECAPAIASAPCLTTGQVTFGSFSNFGKVTDAVLAAWGHILAQVPGARLLIKASGVAEPAVIEPLKQRLVRAGLDLQRVELLPHTRETAAHLALYHRVDIALDTFPYNGTTTICEALWMGVPVITLVGDRHAARVGQSLLQAVGHDEWIGTTADDYVRRAVALAADPARLGAVRAGLRREMMASPLLDHAGQAQRFGDALRRCWSAWCAQAATPAAAQ
jgi:predicted O-linked N-acetylglucosamine transferase (SPINDLY family)